MPPLNMLFKYDNEHRSSKKFHSKHRNGMHFRGIFVMAGRFNKISTRMLTQSNVALSESFSDDDFIGGYAPILFCCSHVGFGP